jgi:trimeric autotransporter adhesin
MKKKIQRVASRKRASAGNSDVLAQAISRAREIAAGASVQSAGAVLTTLSLLALPQMAHAETLVDATPQSGDTRFMYSSQVSQALGALPTNRDVPLAAAVSNVQAQGSNALVTFGDPSLPPSELIKSGPTDKTQQIEALGSDSIAIGLNTHANGELSVAIGSNTSAANEGAVAVGNSAVSSGIHSTAIGVNAEATNGDRSLAIGYRAQSGSTDSIVIGNNSVIGDTADTTTDNAIAVGSKNLITGANSAVLGNGLTVRGTDSFVLGSNTKVTGSNSVVLGAASDGSQSNVVSIGAKGSERKIVNVAPGTLSATSTDAVNASQLHKVVSSTAAALGGGAALGTDGTISAPSYTVGDKAYSDVGSAIDAVVKTGVAGSADAVRYDDASKASVTFGGTAATVLSNVARGSANADAVNISQLKDTGLTLDASGNATNALVAYDDTGKSRVTLGGTSGTLITNLAKGTNDTDAVNFSQLKSAGLTVDSNGNPANSFVAYDNAGKGVVTFGGSAGTVLKNVASGTNDTDAVNFSQLKSAGLTVDSNGNAANSFVAYDNAGKGVVTFGGSAGTVLKNVANGTDDTDAVNFRQLKSAGLTVDSNGNPVNSFVTYDTASKGKITLSGTSGTLITNLAKGTNDTDAVNFSQLKSAGLTVDSNGNAANSFVAYDNASKGKITLSGTSGTLITNLANGTNDTDAVNFSQLKSAGLTVDSNGNAANSFVAYDNAGKGIVTFGGSAGTVLKNVAKGTDDTDAVNFSQLKSAGLTVDSNGNAANSFVAYDNAGKGVVTFGGSAGTVLKNIAKGTDDTDAVNFGQLKSAGLTVDSNGNAANSFVAYDEAARGKITLGGSDGTTIANVKAGVDDHDAVNVAQLKGAGLVDSSGKTMAAVVYDTSADGSVNRGQVTLGGASASAPVALRNVAAGRLVAGSTDAVNGDQLAQTVQMVNDLQNGGSLKYFTTNTTLAAAQASGADALAIGGNAQASGQNAVALGANSVADRADSVSVGAAGQERQITNVKAGTADTDAVNVSQLKSTGLIDSKGAVAAALTYDKTASGATDYANVTLGNGVAGGTALHNVAAGALVGDAVNVGQLNDAIGRVANFTAVSTAFFSADGNSSTEAAVTSGTHAVAVGASALASGANALAMGAGAKASADNSVALGAGAIADRANSVSVGSAGAERQITNVAAGTSATDAVNLDQLNRASSNAVGQANSYTDQRFNNTDQQIRDLDHNTRKGIAAASALNVVTPYLPGRTAVNAGVAAYRGQAALGIGVSRWNEKGNFNFNAGVSSSGGNSTIVRAGIGYVFGS